MAPRRRPPPELTDDAIAEILLRLPPDDPACLARASLVCKPWRHLLADPGFPRRYREFHGALPLLGFLRRTRSPGANSVFHLVPITAAFPSPLPSFDCCAPHYGGWQALDCRHGRVLLYLWDEGGISLALWDPITGDRTVLPNPRPGSIPPIGNGVVLCAMAGCNHLDCRSGPFRVVLLGSSWRGAGACVYSSEAGEWTAPASVHFHVSTFARCRDAVVAGDDLYFRIDMDYKIIKYDLGKHCLSIIDLPPIFGKFALMATEDASLGAAAIKDSSFHLWLREVKQDGVARWVRRSVTKLDTLISAESHLLNKARVCFTEGLGRIVFVNTDVGLFSIELKSWRVKKLISEHRDCHEILLPFMSFYTPGTDFASNKLPLHCKRRRINY